MIYKNLFSQVNTGSYALLKCGAALIFVTGPSHSQRKDFNLTFQELI
ncbi:hypothetical protein KHQ08_00490 (plasmid) [Pseudochrobactrum algeriensis]|nr:MULTISPECIES: hypothetical protein [Pseudochrobactrum]QVQ35409.1 hypothetical protein KHQ08_00490 [Pseudochrobactrum algeriensis]QVQ42024.1 hypothetical protein KHQ07_16360 [Pseudochrobactrum algeriensis]QVQ42639.1 hypothetical protein KHQ09_01155 [Pseudochrobactrum algeriensis]UCA47641.1 hypothetical protein LDL70_16450 [Pseudochrobactrum sp. XF203]